MKGTKFRENMANKVGRATAVGAFRRRRELFVEAARII
jgi:hypothetical protein